MSYFAGVDIGGIDIIRAGATSRALPEGHDRLPPQRQFVLRLRSTPPTTASRRPRRRVPRQVHAGSSRTFTAAGRCSGRWRAQRRWSVRHHDGADAGRCCGDRRLSASDDSGHDRVHLRHHRPAPPPDLSGGYFDPQPTYQRGTALTASNTLPAVGSAAVVPRHALAEHGHRARARHRHRSHLRTPTKGDAADGHAPAQLATTAGHAVATSSCCAKVAPRRRPAARRQPRLDVRLAEPPRVRRVQ